MPKSLDSYFSETLGQLTVQNTLLRAQLEQAQETLETVTKERDDLRTKLAEYEPEASAKDNIRPLKKDK